MTQEAKDDTPRVVRWLTIPGRFLLIVTILGFGALFVWYFLATAPDIPAGSYPILLWLVPTGLASFLFFLTLAFILEKFGIRIYRRSREQDQRPPQVPLE